MGQRPGMFPEGEVPSANAEPHRATVGAECADPRSPPFLEEGAEIRCVAQATIGNGRRVGIY
jgi:hypothetical protein